MSNADRSRYYGYFQNEHGDQWLFIYDRAQGTAILRGGDAQWEKVHTLRGPDDLPFSMTESEKAWVLACWAAASFGAGSTVVRSS